MYSYKPQQPYYDTAQPSLVLKSAKNRSGLSDIALNSAKGIVQEEAKKQALKQGVKQLGLTESLGAIAPYAGIAGGLYGGYRLADNFNNMNAKQGAVTGLASGASLGAGIGSLVPGIGTLVGAGVGGALGAGIGAFAHKPLTKVEEAKWRALNAQTGAALPEWVAQGKDIKAKDAGYRADLANDFVGVADTGGMASGFGQREAGDWVNNKFAKSRNVADLTGKDIWGYADFTSSFGPDWMNTSEGNREAIANKALELGLVNEGKGTITLNNNEALNSYAQSLFKTPEAAAPTPQGNSSSPSKPKSKRPGAPAEEEYIEPIPTATPRVMPQTIQARPQGADFLPGILDVQKQNTVRPSGLGNIYGQSNPFSGGLYGTSVLGKK
jgi:hypothetical protein